MHQKACFKAQDWHVRGHLMSDKVIFNEITEEPI